MKRLTASDLKVQELALRRTRARRPRFIAVSPEPPNPQPPDPQRHNSVGKGLYRTRQVHKLDRAPYASVGILVCGEDGTATTAWLVSPHQILTAAHPLRERRHYFFGLQYSRESGGIWRRLVRAQVLQGWYQARDYRCDLALGWLNQPLEAPLLLPLAPPSPLPEQCLILGYSFGTATLWQSHSHKWSWNSQGGRVATNLTEGSSGGPWLVRTSQGYSSIGLTSRGGEGFLLSPSWKGPLQALLESVG